MLPYSDWLDRAELLREGESRRTPHICGPGKTLLVSHTSKGFDAWCYRCNEGGFKPHGVRTLEQLAAAKEARAYAYSQNRCASLELPADFTQDIPAIGRMWYWRAGITDALAKLYGLGWSGAQQRVVLPITDPSDGSLVYVQSRAVREGQQPKYLNIRASGRAGLGFFSDPRTVGYYERPGERVAEAQKDCSTPGTRVVMCEDVLSSIRVGLSVQSGALLGTKLDDALARRLTKFQRVTFWLDGDTAGIKGRLQAMRTLKLVHPGEVDYIRSPDDPKCYSQKEIERWLLGS